MMRIEIMKEFNCQAPSFHLVELCRPEGENFQTQPGVTMGESRSWTASWEQGRAPVPRYTPRSQVMQYMACLVSWTSLLQFEHRVPFFRPLCASLFCEKFRRSDGGLATCRKRDGPSRKDGFFLTFGVCTWEERVEPRLVGLFSVVVQSQTFQHWRGVSSSIRSHVACVFNHRKEEYIIPTESMKATSPATGPHQRLNL